MGSPAFAVPSLRAVHEAFEIVCVYSQPPRPAGRGQQVQKTPVHALAEELGLPVRTPERLKGEFLEELMAMEVDAICVVAYGLLLPKRLVDSKICLNVHPSALPRWRGAAPVQWTLLSGDTTTDICVMRLDEGMDTGPVLTRCQIDVNDGVTCGQLAEQCSQTGAKMLVANLGQLDTLPGVPQTGEPTHARKLTSADRKVNWAEPAAGVHNRIRAFAPAPGAFFEFGGEMVKVLRSQVAGGGMAGAVARAAGLVVAAGADGIDVVCGDGGVLRLLEVQRPGRKAMAAGPALAGWDMKPGITLA